MYLTIAGIVFFATFAMTVQMGVWNNLITLMAIVMGGIVAFGVEQPLTVMIDEQTGGSYTYVLEFPILWGVFALTTGLLKALAQALSRNRVNFPEQFDNFGGAGIGFVTALTMTSFAMATFHTAPLSYDMFGGKYEYGVTPGDAKSKLDQTFAPSSPDVVWLNLSQSVLSPAAMGQQVPGIGGSTMDGFSRDVFVSQNGKHRKTFGSIEETAVKRK